MNSSRKLFTNIIMVALFYTSCMFSATKGQIKHKLDALKAQLSAIDTHLLSTTAHQEAKNAQIKHNFDQIKAVMKEIIEQQQEMLTSQ